MRKLCLGVLALFPALVLIACGDATGAKNGGIRLLRSVDGWPSGVYDAHGIPPYQAGKIAYAPPADRAGTVYIQTTREELLAYAGQLLARGFRFKDDGIQVIRSKIWESVEIFFPDSGGRHSLSCYFNFERDGQGTNEKFWLDDGVDAADEDEEIPVYYNLSMRITNYDIPEGITEKGLLTGIGLPDAVVIPPCAVELDTPLAILDPPNYVYSFASAFDYELTEEAQRTHAEALIDACAAAADDGRLIAMTGQPLEAQAAKTENLSTWSYMHQGRKIMIRLIGDSGYGGSIALTARAAS